MQYPDGSMIQIGDLIWWDEGFCVGYVQAIEESKTEYESWGQNEPHIFVSNNHPFDATTHSGVAYPESSLADDGIARLNPEERLEFDRAAVRAHRLVATDSDCYAVTTEVRDSRLHAWIFTYYKDDKNVQAVSVPASQT